jgi:peptidyl-prolyl cis-trans isomerase D
MLTQLRNIGRTWIVKVLMGLLVLSFGLWGIADIFRGFRSSYVATVGGAEVPVTVFQQSYTRELRSLENQFGQRITESNAVAMGLPDRVLSQLLAEAAMQSEAEDLRLGVSNDMLVELIARDPTFQTNGKFDRNRFIALLRSNNLSEAGYVEAQRSLELRRQIAAAVNGGLVLPAAYANAVHAYRGEERSIQFLVLGAPQAGDVGTPGDTELGVFFEAHKADWRAPEYRALTLVTLSPSNLAKPDDVSDDDVRARYEANKAAYGTPETRRVRQIVFPTRPDADAALARIKGGETFEAIMASRDLKPADVDLGVVTRDKIIDPIISDAAFALAPNQTSDVIDGRFTTIVSAIAAGDTKMYEEVRNRSDRRSPSGTAADVTSAAHATILLAARRREIA